MRKRITPEVRYVLTLCLASAASISLLAISWHANRASAPIYLLWNLCLAWTPFILAVGLIQILRRRAWSSWGGLAVTGVWLAFLPNSFYMVSDFIHLPEMNSGSTLFDAVLFASFILTALALGISSLYLVHLELRRRLPRYTTAVIIAGILLLCCIAIYIGRDLRWNTWDVLVDPMGLLFDLSSRLLRPSEYGQIFGVVAPFFVLLSCFYLMAWQSRKI